MCTCIKIPFKGKKPKIIAKLQCTVDQEVKNTTAFNLSSRWPGRRTTAFFQYSELDLRLNLFKTKLLNKTFFQNNVHLFSNFKFQVLSNSLILCCMRLLRRFISVPCCFNISISVICCLRLLSSEFWFCSICIIDLRYVFVQTSREQHQSNWSSFVPSVLLFSDVYQQNREHELFADKAFLRLNINTLLNKKNIYRPFVTLQKRLATQTVKNYFTWYEDDQFI